MESASRPGLLRRAYYAVTNWWDRLDTHDRAWQAVRTPTPKEQAKAERYWSAQAKLPLRQRSVGWWTEIGLGPVVIVAAIVVAVVFIL